jgi:aminoglycoside phosphotransferase
MLLQRTCKQVALLLIAREDQLINLSDQAALKLHMIGCKSCPMFENQILTMRAAMKRWRNYTGDEDSLASGQPDKN